jgi:uncharacterized protein (DUF1499 family)
MHVSTYFDYPGVMKNIFSKRLPLYVWILLSACHGAAGPATASNRFSPCPDSPNCVSSQSPDKARFIEPFHYIGNREDARQKLINILENTKRVRLVKVETDYIHAEFRSFLFRFVDDVEFYFVPEETIIHVKSASRTGYYDFGANRRRVERLRSTIINLAK